MAGAGGMGLGFEASPAQGTAGLINVGAGYLTKRKGEKEMKAALASRPIYTVSSEYDTNIDLASRTRNMYSDLTKSNQMPGQQYAEDEQSQIAANSMAQAQMMGTTNPAILAQLSQNALQVESQASRSFSIEGARQRQENYGSLAMSTQALQSANTAKAEEKDKAFDYNLNQPHQNKIDQARKKTQSGTEMMQKGGDMWGSSSKMSGSI